MKRRLGPEKARITFLPSVEGHAYFDDLCKRLTEQSRLGVRITQRQAFDHMMELAKIGEETLRARTGLRKAPDRMFNPILMRP